jgi:hypothetical protein
MHWVREINFGRFVKNHWPVLAVLGLAFALRLVGIKHGFPYIYHPDEPYIIRNGLGIRFNPRPANFDWPHLYLYANYFAFMGFAAFRVLITGVGLRPLLSSVFPIIWSEEVVFYLITRVFTASLGSLTVIPVYLIGKKLFSEKVGLFAALAIAVFPFHVWHSHYALTDVPMAFFVAWAMYFSAVILSKDKDRLVDYGLAGLFVGLAASTKYNGASSALFVALAYFFKHLVVRKDLKSVFSNFYFPLLAGVASVMSFFAGTPYAILRWSDFTRTDGPQGALWQFTNVGKTSFSNQINHFFLGFTTNFASDWSYVFSGMFVVGVLLIAGLLISRKICRNTLVRLLFLYIPALTFLFYVSGFSKRQSHYYMMAYPAVAAVVGWVAYKINKVLGSRIAALTLVLLFSFPLYSSIRRVQVFVTPDNRTMAADWVYERAESLDLDDITFYYQGHRIYMAFELEDRAKKYTDGRELQTPYIAVVECSKEFSEFSARTPAVTFTREINKGPKMCVYEEI